MRYVRLSTTLFKLGESIFHMGSEYMREASVLVLVFIPLDLWKHEEITETRLALVFGGSVLVFFCGVAFQWTAYAVKVARAIWDKEELTEHGPNGNS